MHTCAKLPARSGVVALVAVHHSVLDTKWGRARRWTTRARTHGCYRLRRPSVRPVSCLRSPASSSPCAVDGPTSLTGGTAISYGHDQRYSLPSHRRRRPHRGSVFLNDVLYSYTDILRLLQYPAHLVCGLDLGMAAYPDLTPLEHQDTIESYLRGAWHLSPGLAHTLSRSRLLAHRWRRLHQFHEPDLRAYGPLFFYDKWVARDISGRMFSNRPPFVGFPPDILRVTAGKLVRAHCCWNGLAIFTAAPFLAKKMRFRQHEPGECSASECSLVCDDMWRRGLTWWSSGIRACATTPRCRCTREG